MASLADRVEVLRKAPLFRGVSKRSLQRIARSMTEVDAPKGQVLVEPRTVGSGMFVIWEGKVTVEAPGRRRELGPGDFFGELALMRPDALRTARVRAKTPVRCLAIGRADLRTILLEEPKVAMTLLDTALERMAEPR